MKQSVLIASNGKKHFGISAYQPGGHDTWVTTDDIKKTAPEIRKFDKYLKKDIAAAILEAVEAGYKEIRIYRVFLFPAYKKQFSAIKKAINHAKENGVKVVWPWYKYLSTIFAEVEEIEPTIEDLKAEIKAKGGKVPRGKATFGKLTEVLNKLNED